MSDEILLSDVRRLHVAPGESLLVTVPDVLSTEECERIHHGFAANLPGVNVLVVTDSIDVTVVAPGTEG